MLPLLATILTATSDPASRALLSLLTGVWVLATGLAAGVAVQRGKTGLTRGRITALSILDFVLLIAVTLVASPSVLFALPAFSLLSYLQALLWGRRGAYLAAVLSLLASTAIALLRASHHTPSEMVLTGLWAFQNTAAVVLLGFYAERQGRIVRAVWSQARRDRELAVRDPLTGLHNRRFLDQRLAEEVARARRSGSRLALAVIDVDYLKRWNDTFGHAAGDAALRALAHFLRRSCRTQDVVCRVGGEEFVVVAPDTDAEGLRHLLDRIRATVPSVSLQPGETPLPQALTFSAGVAAVEPSHTPAALLDAADGALYAAKHAGRNRVLVAGPAED